MTTRNFGRIAKLTVVAAGALTAGACADGSTGLLSTASIGSAPASVAGSAPKADPACVALTARIDTLRKDGVVDRVEKASAGKSKTVSVKRESLAKVAELDKANAEFQAKCALPLTTASVSPAPAPSAAQVSAVQAGAAQQAKTAAAATAVTTAQKVAKP
jgi:hypothetical protein